MAAARHLEFLKFKFLTVGAVKRPILHHGAKFREDWSNRCWDIAILVIFKTAAAAILDFHLKIRNFNSQSSVGINMRCRAKFH